jgi:pentapeptide repeat protein
VDDQQQFRWRPTRRQVLWAGAAVSLLTAVVLIGYRYGISLWDWIKLLIIPAVIAGGGLWFNRQQRERELAIAREQRERDVEIADRRAQDEALQAYLDQIGQLLLDKDRPLRQSKEDDEVRTLARTRTLTVLRRLDDERKASVLQFLHESGLIAKKCVVVYLGRADLSRANLIKSNLIGAYLSMSDLIEADLSGADLSDADLSGANMEGTNLFSANLSNAKRWTEHQLTAAQILEGATMPNGEKYEDWLKGDLCPPCARAPAALWR